MLNLDSGLGIEIRPDRLIFTLVKKGFREFSLKGHSVIENYRELSTQELRNLIDQYVKSNGFNRENVILGIPREEVVIRSIKLPLDVEENLEQVIRFQVEKFEPSDEERSSFDHLVLARDEKKNEIHLAIFMARRAVIDEYLNLFRELDLYPAAIRFSGFALHQVLRIHEHRYPTKNPVVILDLHPGLAEAVVVENHQRFSSEILCRDPQPLSTEGLMEALGIYLSRLELASEGIARIYLSGPLAGEYLEAIQSRVGDCELLADKLRLKQKPAAHNLGSELVTAIGLGVSSLSRSSFGKLNLIPQERRIVGERPSLIPSFGLGSLVLLLAVALLTRGYFQQHFLLGQLEDQFEVLQPQVNEVMAIRDELERKKSEAMELREIMSGSQKMLFVLRDLTERLPDDTYLQMLQMQGQRVTMQGYSDNAAGLLPILLDSAHLASVENNWITPERSMPNKSRFNFGATIKP